MEIRAQQKNWIERVTKSLFKRYDYWLMVDLSDASSVRPKSRFYKLNQISVKNTTKFEFPCSEDFKGKGCLL